MKPSPLARVVFGANAAVVVAGLAAQLPAAYDSTEGYFTAHALDRLTARRRPSPTTVT